MRSLFYAARVFLLCIYSYRYSDVCFDAPKTLAERAAIALPGSANAERKPLKEQILGDAAPTAGESPFGDSPFAATGGFVATSTTPWASETATTHPHTAPPARPPTY